MLESAAARSTILSTANKWRTRGRVSVYIRNSFGQHIPRARQYTYTRFYGSCTFFKQSHFAMCETARDDLAVRTNLRPYEASMQIIISLFISLDCVWYLQRRRQNSCAYNEKCTDNILYNKPPFNQNCDTFSVSLAWQSSLGLGSLYLRIVYT